MNREIKFKIWDKKLNVMWEPIELPTLLRYLIFQNCPNATAYEALKDHFQDMVWLEFTGLKDRNGKEIYEGDILERPISEDKDLLRVPVKFVTSGYNAFFDFGSLPQPSKCEIVGNIFENLELLDF